MVKPVLLVIAALGLIPLAGFVESAVEELAELLGPFVGGFLHTTFSNVATARPRRREATSAISGDPSVGETSNPFASISAESPPAPHPSSRMAAPGGSSARKRFSRV